jgi:hypothetical protein
VDNSFRRHGSDAQQPSGFLASVQIFDNILNWLAGLIQLTEEEQKDAGIYVDNQH